MGEEVTWEELVYQTNAYQEEEHEEELGREEGRKKKEDSWVRNGSAMQKKHVYLEWC